MHYFGYLRKYGDYGLLYPHKHEDTDVYKILQDHKISPTKLVGFSDSSWQDCPDTGRSTGGYLIYYYGNLIDAHTSMPVPIAMSSAEAEYMSAYNLCMKLAHLRMLVYDIENMGSPNFDTDPETPTVVLIDNQATVSMSKSKKVTSKNRHTRRREHYVRQGQERGEHNLNWLPAKFQLADIMTKTQDSKIYLPLFTKVFTKIPNCVEGTKSNN